jgi:hypothetical protein
MMELIVLYTQTTNDIDAHYISRWWKLMNAQETQPTTDLHKAQKLHI